MTSSVDLGTFVRQAHTQGKLVVQPRMGMADPTHMANGLKAVMEAPARAVGTITLDSYTRIGDYVGAQEALTLGRPLNGFPIVLHGPETTRRVICEVGGTAPVQVRHGSARPHQIFRTMVEANLSATEGGPVSYCLPYGRTPLTESIAHWRDAAAQLAQDCRSRGLRAHLETFGGCLLGQLCPPSLLVAMSVLESMFFVQRGIESLSLSYAQQTNAVQDIEALAALRLLAEELLPENIEWHIVLYTYMGVYPKTAAGATRLLELSVDLAVRGGAERLIVKTASEAWRIPTVPENIEALARASARASQAVQSSDVPWAHEVDHEVVLAEARTLIEAVLDLSDDIGQALRRAFSCGLLDVPYCLHQDNHGLSQTAIDTDGRLRWARLGNLPLAHTIHPPTFTPVRAHDLLKMLKFVAQQNDRDLPPSTSHEQLAGR